MAHYGSTDSALFFSKMAAECNNKARKRKAQRRPHPLLDFRAVYILALESSCDETACAVIEAEHDYGHPQHRLLVRADVVASQATIHARFGGVVPEVAARHHIQNLIPVIDEALDAGRAVSRRHLGAGGDEGAGPDWGRCSSLFRLPKRWRLRAGCRWSGSITWRHTCWLRFFHRAQRRSLMCGHRCLTWVLLVSGGHSSLVLVHDFGHYEVLGTTCDDAAGEAFDKVGKLLGLGYPAGPLIDRLSTSGDPLAVPMPCVRCSGRSVVCR
jgi:hypothetical protein